MSTMKPRKRGLYVYYSAELLPVTGPRQSALASARIPLNLRVPIERWDGESWTSTGLVLIGSRAS